MKTWHKVALGVGVGCGVLVMLGVGACAVGIWWVLTPGRQVDPLDLVGGSPVAVVASDRLSTDPGVHDLAATVLREVERRGRAAQRESLPENLRWIQALNANRDPAAGLRMWVPRSVALFIDRDDVGPASRGTPWAAAINPSMFSRMFRLIVEHAAPGQDRHPYRGYTITGSDDGPFLCFAGGTVLVSGSLDEMTAVLDRVEGRPDAGTTRSELTTSVSTLLERFDVGGVFDSGGVGIVAGALRIAGIGGLDAAERVAVGVDVVDADNARLEATATFPDRDALEPFGTAWREGWPGVARILLERGIEAGARIRLEQNTAVVTVEFRGLGSAAVAGLAALETRPPVSGPSP